MYGVTEPNFLYNYNELPACNKTQVHHYHVVIPPTNRDMQLYHPPEMENRIVYCRCSVIEWFNYQAEPYQREGEGGGMRRRRGCSPYTTRGAVAVPKILVRTYQSVVVVVQKICCMPTDGHSWPLISSSLRRVHVVISLTLHHHRIT